MGVNPGLDSPGCCDLHVRRTLGVDQPEHDRIRIPCGAVRQPNDYFTLNHHTVMTVYLFLLRILHGNTACQHVVAFGGRTLTDSAYCQALGRENGHR